MPVPISERALVARLRRKLDSEDNILRRSRGWRAQLEYGDWYVVDIYTNCVVAWGGLEVLAREWGVLQSYEEVVTKEAGLRQDASS
jgi:hypothetical protein